MKYYSEELKKYYDTAEACENAEAEYFKKLEEEKKQNEEKSKMRKERASEVQKAFEDFRKAERNYYELRNKFIEDYGYYHMTYSTTEDLDKFNINKLWDELFGWMN